MAYAKRIVGEGIKSCPGPNTTGTIKRFGDHGTILENVSVINGEVSVLPPVMAYNHALVLKTGSEMRRIQIKWVSILITRVLKTFLPFGEHV